MKKKGNIDFIPLEESESPVARADSEAIGEFLYQDMSIHSECGQFKDNCDKSFS